MKAETTLNQNVEEIREIITPNSIDGTSSPCTAHYIETAEQEYKVATEKTEIEQDS